MKKLMAMLLAAVMALGCAAAFAESAATKIESADGQFAISFELPEGTELLSGAWDAEGKMYQANLKGRDGLYFYLAVAAPETSAESDEEETVPVTYNEDNGYTDDYLKSMLNELFGDDFDNIQTAVHTTAYGTKLAVVRNNDPEGPFAYIFTVWNGYEIGVTVDNSSDCTLKPITDEQINAVVNFLSEAWMNVKEAEAPAA